VQRYVVNPRHRAQQVVGKLATDGSANLGDFLGRTESVQPRHQRSGSSLTIAGTTGIGGARVQTINGSNAHRGFFVYAGNVTLENLTIENAVAQGGAGSAGGGGGAGFGGGLFVASAGAVTLDDVSFSNDAAQGGAGGGGQLPHSGGGGGLGGGGGAGEGGGGGIGLAASGGGNGGRGGTGIIPGAAAAGKGAASGGASGGGGGGGGTNDTGGAGGGIDGASGSGFSGGGGGFGGGGGGGASDGGGGGFGGGGGAGRQFGGIGGFGGGGGGGGATTGSNGAGSGSFGGGGAGGFGGGMGANGFAGGHAGGGGGLGAGGDIFVQQGGSLTIEGGSLSGGKVQGGHSLSDGGSGQALGSGIFVQGNYTLSLAPPSGQTLTIGDVIADESRSGGTGSNAGAVAAVIDGVGTAVFSATNTYTGGTTLKSGTLELDAPGAAGGGGITFAAGISATLAVDNPALPNGVLANSIAGFAIGDTIDLTGLLYSSSKSSATLSGTTLTVTNGGTPDKLTLTGLAAGTSFAVVPDASGTGTSVQIVAQTAFSVSDEAELNAAIRAISVNGHDAAANIAYTIDITGPINLTTALSAIDLDTGSSLIINGSNGAGGAYAINGMGGQRGFVVSAGNVTLENLTIEDAVAQGGAGGFSGGGGGAGLGGGLFVAAAAVASLTNVDFTGDAAKGGNGSAGRTAAGGLSFPGPSSGAGGGFGDGGFFTRRGFGGGAAGLAFTSAGATFTVGGGGLGAGGDIFVQTGGALTIEGGSLTGGSVAGGNGSGGTSKAGSAFGSGVFIQGNQTITLAPPSAQTLTIEDVIADEPGSNVATATTGAGGVLVDGAGTVVFDAANTYTGGTTLDAGRLELQNVGAAGTGAITFAPGKTATLAVDKAALSMNSLANSIADFAIGDALDLPGLAYVSGNTTATLNGTTLTVTAGTATPDTLTLTSVVSGTFFTAVQDQGTGTLVEGIADAAPTITATGTTLAGHGKTIAIDTFTLGLPSDVASVQVQGGGTTTPDGGTLSVVGNNTVDYAAAASPASTTDSFTLVVTDQLGASARTAETITIDPGPSLTSTAPAKVGHGQTVAVGPATPGLSGDTLILVPGTGPKDGGLSLAANGSVSYAETAAVPVGGLTDTFSYQVKDQLGELSNTITTTVALDPGPSLTSTAPAKVGHGQTVAVGTATPGLSGDTLILVPGTGPKDGALSLAANGSVSYAETAAVPAGGLTDTFSYQVKDQLDELSNAITTTVALDPGPTAGNAQLDIAPGGSVDLTSLLLALDTRGLPGDTLSLSAVGTPTGNPHGTTTLQNGDLKYTAPASGSTDSFTYQVSDQLGDVSPNGTVNVTLQQNLAKGGQITLSSSDTVVDAGNSNSSVSVTGSSDTVVLGTGNNTVTMTGNNNNVASGAGNDSVSLAGDHNTVVLGGGNDNVSLSGNNNTATLGNGNDSVTAGANSTITLGNGNDTVYAGAGDTITLGNGHDTLYAGPGDTITLGSGKNLLLFGVNPSPSIMDSEIVNGFNPNNDIIEFNRALFANFTAVLADAKQVGGDTIITHDPNNTVTLHGVALAALTANNVKTV